MFWLYDTAHYVWTQNCTWYVKQYVLYAAWVLISLFLCWRNQKYKQQHMYNQTHQLRTIFSLGSQNTQSMLSSYKKYKTCKLLHNRKAQKVLSVMQ